MSSNAKKRDEIAGQAIDWLVQLDAGTADPETFEAWRGADPLHASIFAQVAATWQNTGKLRFAAGAEPEEGSPAPVEDLGQPAPRASGATGRRGAIGALAAGLVAIAAGTGYFLSDRRSFAETGVGERRTVQLPDGSRADLNTDTLIAWHMGEALELWVERGEAAIAVAGQAARDFVLHARTLQATLEQGAYNLRLHEEGPHLAVMSGKARIRGHGRSTTLGPNQLLRDGEIGFVTHMLTEEERQRASAWQRGEIVFDGMSLAAALGEFNRYLPRPMMLADPDIGAIRLGGRFRTDDPEGFLLSIEDTFGIGNRREDGRILLYRRD